MIEERTKALFKKWCLISKRESGGGLRTNSANDYCAFLNDCQGWDFDIFVPHTDGLLEVAELKALCEALNGFVQTLTVKQLAPRSRISDVRAALKMYGKFLLWLIRNRPIWTCDQVDRRLDEIRGDENKQSNVGVSERQQLHVNVGTLTEGALKAYLVEHFGGWTPPAQNVMARARRVCRCMNTTLDGLVRTKAAARSVVYAMEKMFPDLAQNGIACLQGAVRHCCKAKYGACEF